MWKLKLTQATLVALIYGACHYVVGLEPVYGYDQEANLTAMLTLGGMPTSHYIDENGFAFRLNDYWIGLYEGFEPAIDSPVLLWGWVCRRKPIARPS